MLAIGVLGSIIALWRFGTLNVGYSYDDWGWGLVRIIFPFFVGILIYRLHAAGGLSFRPIPFVVLASALGAVLAMPEVPAIDALTLFALIPLFVELGAQSQSDKGWSFWTGYISYPINVIHYPIIRICSNAIRRFDLSGWQLYAAIVAELVSIVLLAFLAAPLFDEPIRKWLGSRRSISSVP